MLAVTTRISSMGVCVLGLSVILNELGLTAGALGLASVSGLAFSIAAKSLVENLIGGTVILFRRP
jgi:small-conductance mechanosensitive channel